MRDDRNGQVAVIFTSQRTGEDAEGYANAAAAMDARAATQPGYRGMDSVSNAEGAGITVSYWADEAAALHWRDDPEHAATREAGRGRWYASYSVVVAIVDRSYDWTRS